MGVLGFLFGIAKPNHNLLIRIEIYSPYSSLKLPGKMSKHLSKGSAKPEKLPEGKLRLYSMAYCPFAQRARLVLLAKNIPHEIVNINLFDKPEWYSEVHSEGKVPALDTGSNIVVESLDIVNYLDEHYPTHPLYPAEPEAREFDKSLIEKIVGITSIFGKLFYGSEKKSAEEWLKEYKPQLEIFDNELEKRGSIYFGGDKPSMVDYILWPWAERAGVIQIVLGERLPFEDSEFPKLRAWRKAMRKESEVDAIFNEPVKHHKVILFKDSPTTADYDNV